MMKKISKHAGPGVFLFSIKNVNFFLIPNIILTFVLEY